MIDLINTAILLVTTLRIVTHSWVQRCKYPIISRMEMLKVDEQTRSCRTVEGKGDKIKGD